MFYWRLGDWTSCGTNYLWGDPKMTFSFWFCHLPLDHKEIYFHLFVIETGMTANCQKTFVWMQLIWMYRMHVIEDTTKTSPIMEFVQLFNSVFKILLWLSPWNNAKVCIITTDSDKNIIDNKYQLYREYSQMSVPHVKVPKWVCLL